jgi:UDP-N-acetylmuramyl pentapeptide phosphotransferase/UDP-N-acetylglucosamine-1-phosphate transferase
MTLSKNPVSSLEAAFTLVFQLGDFVPIIVLSIAAYFLIAAFVPRIRPRWGVSKGTKRRRVLGPRLGMVTCIGISVFIGGFALPMIWTRTPHEWLERILSAGFALVGIGAILDWFVGPTDDQRK